jgi:hypothetical protein
MQQVKWIVFFFDISKKNMCLVSFGKYLIGFGNRIIAFTNSLVRSLWCIHTFSYIFWWEIFIFFGSLSENFIISSVFLFNFPPQFIKSRLKTDKEAAKMYGLVTQDILFKKRKKVALNGTIVMPYLCTNEYMTYSIWKPTSNWIDLLGSQLNFLWILLDYF